MADKIIKIKLTQEQYDCIDAGIREDLSPEEWLTGAAKGKAHNCGMKTKMEQFNKLSRDPKALKAALEALEKG
jgi:hypothetical protein